MRPLTAAAAAAAMGGQLAAPGAAEARFTAVFTDSRAPIAGGLFFALTGPTFDGHRFLAAAAAAGAAGVVVTDPHAARELPDDVAVIVVDDTLAGLTRLAAHARAGFTGRVVAVTGSVGKTTVKDMIAAALTAFGAVHRTPGNWNNHVGVPLTLLAASGDEELVVLELGMSAPGEIDALTRLARPHVGVVVNAAAAHLAFFPSVDAIADAKAELFEALPRFSRAVANADDPRVLARARARAGARTLTFGGAVDADVRVVGAELTRVGLVARIDAAGEALTVRLAALGGHNAHNAAAALAVARALDLDLRLAATSLGRHFRPAKHRLAVVRGVDGLTLLDDTYNANPVSAHAALAALVAAAGPGANLGAVLGTMRELGPDAPALHAALGAAAAHAGLTWVAATGAHAEDLARGARDAGLADVHTAADAAELVAAARAFAGPDRWLLLKGSRGERLERLVDALAAGADDAAAATDTAAATDPAAPIGGRA